MTATRKTAKPTAPVEDVATIRCHVFGEGIRDVPLKALRHALGDSQCEYAIVVDIVEGRLTGDQVMLLVNRFGGDEFIVMSVQLL